MDSTFWDDRFASSPARYGDANALLVEHLTPFARDDAGAPPRTAYDVGAGQGRNAAWLAEHGWDVTAVDFSATGLRQTRELLESRGLRASYVQADVRRWRPGAPADLVVAAYLHLPDADRARFWRTLAAAVAPGGLLFVVGHCATEPEPRHGPGQEVRFTSAEIAAALVDGTSGSPGAPGGDGAADGAWEILARGPVERDGAIDALLVARRLDG
ncbi:class I SAM-dependent methyltransferase [Corynebacterium sp. 335C]